MAPADVCTSGLEEVQGRGVWAQWVNEACDIHTRSEPLITPAVHFNKTGLAVMKKTLVCERKKERKKDGKGSVASEVSRRK